MAKPVYCRKISAAGRSGRLVEGLVLLLGLSGCGRDPALAPPVGAEVITVTLKVPETLSTRVMTVMYRSTLCQRTGYTASGKSYKRDGYQSTELQPERLGLTDVYEARLPIDGGGDCKWRLSNVTFGVRHANPKLFGDNVTHGAGGGVIVIFDHNASSRGSATFKVESDLVLKEDYYPWVSETFLGSYKKTVSLRGRGQDIFLMYKAAQARKVYFEPVLHSAFIVRSQGPKVKREGGYSHIFYPDGSVQVDGRNGPAFEKLQDIRQRMEGMQ